MRRNEPIAIVDVRLPSDYQAGHIPGAINLPQGKWHTLTGCRKDRTHGPLLLQPDLQARRRRAVNWRPRVFPSSRWKAALKPGSRTSCRSSADALGS